MKPMGAVSLGVHLLAAGCMEPTKKKKTLKRAQEDKMDGSHNPALQPFLI